MTSGPPTSGPAAGDAAALSEFAARYTAAWCSRDAARVASFFSENGSLKINDGSPSVGRVAITAAAQGFMTAFPDLVVRMDRLGSEGGRISYHWTLTGTNTGPGGTGKAVRINGYEAWVIGADGLIADSLGHFDEADYRRQLAGGAGSLRYLRSGALAGAAATLVFTLVHGLFISDIWHAAPVMTAAGALSGALIAWTYGLLVPAPSPGTWLRYNLVYLAMFLLLALTSVVVFDPVTTVAALIQAKEPPTALFAKAMPMTVVFLAWVTALLSVLYGRRWRHVGPILLTCAVLLGLLGLNVSVIGLVDVPRGSVHLIAELFGLIFVLDAAYLGAFLALERRMMTR